MSDTAWVITISYSALTIIGVAIGLVVFRSTRVGFRVETAGRKTLERREGYWGIAVISFLVIVLGGTIGSIPYWTDKGDEKVGQSLSVTGRQFAFTVLPAKIRANVKTRIVLKAADVSHAVGIYDPDDVLVRQVNILPDATQKLVMTFKKKGTWELRCLEFCGVDHHLMHNTLEVTG